MNTPISTSSIIFMCISLVLSILLPIGAVVYLAVKKRLNLKAVLWGAVLFPVFALGLEGQGLHRLVFGIFPALQYHPYLFALYGGLAIGMHAFVDFPAVLMRVGVIQNYLVLEGIVAVIAVIYAYTAYRLYRKRPAVPETV